MTAAYAKRTGQDMNLYHSCDQFRKVPLHGLMRHHTWQVNSRITKDNLGCLPLVPGMRVTVTDNTAMTAKVINGCQGVLRDIKYETDNDGNRYAVCAYVHIVGSRLQAPGLDYEVVPILPVRTYFTYGSSDISTGNDRLNHDQ
jgi:hypothetical protein